MSKKSLCVILAILLCFPLTGCWNYQGLNKITLVSGIAIDKDETGIYKLTYEVIDLAGSTKGTGVKSKIIESEGKTIFDAFRNAKKRLVNKLYIGNMQVIIVNQKIAEEDGINSIIDVFLRDGEGRETFNLVVSQQNSAKDLLKCEGTDEKVVSYEIREILDKDKNITCSTKNVYLYQIFNILKGQGCSLALPAFHKVINDDKQTPEANGIAVFKKDKLLGYLSSEETKYFLMATDEVKGGLLTFSSAGMGPDDITLEIQENKTKTSVAYENGKVKTTIKTDTNVYLGELHYSADLIDEEIIKKIEDSAEKMLKEKITNAVKVVQSRYDSDIFCFGNMLYKKDPKLWKKINGDWDKLFSEMDIEVESTVNIVNTAMIVKT